jgi:hypothetical protein
MWVVVDSCCNHYEGVFASEELAKEFAGLCDFDYFEVNVQTEVPDWAYAYNN